MEYEKIPIGEIPISGNVEIEKISIHFFDNHLDDRWYECHIIQKIKMIWSGDIEINHTSKLRFRLSQDEVEQLKEKGLIKTKQVSPNINPLNFK